MQNIIWDFLRTNDPHTALRGSVRLSQSLREWCHFLWAELNWWCHVHQLTALIENKPAVTQSNIHIFRILTYLQHQIKHLSLRKSLWMLNEFIYGSALCTSTWSRTGTVLQTDLAMVVGHYPSPQDSRVRTLSRPIHHIWCWF